MMMKEIASPIQTLPPEARLNTSSVTYASFVYFAASLPC
jgi:hypothetical protein